jgi:hypothetical protein
MIDSLLSFSVVFWLLTGYCHEGFFVQVAIDLRIIAYFSDILLDAGTRKVKDADAG